MSNYDINRDVRDADIRQAVEARRADDTKIMQKVNAANREAFVQKFPGHLEHSMRLVSERLMNCLNKPAGIDLSNTTTWPATPEEILTLCKSLESLEQIRRTWPIVGER